MSESRMATHGIDATGTAAMPPTDDALRDFVAVLSETPVFRAFEEASVRFGDDERAKESYHAFQAAQRALQPYVMLGTATDDQRAELDRLHEAFVSEPSAARLLEAQGSLIQLCGAIDSVLSARIGLRFAATCSPGCCG